MANKRMSTDYPGVFYREAVRVGKVGFEKIYYIVFKQNGKTLEEKVGRQYADRMTPAKANAIRTERIEGKRESRKELRIKEQVKRQEELNRPTVEFLWEKYLYAKRNNTSLNSSKCLYNRYLSNFYSKTPSEITTEQVHKLRHELESKDLSPASVHHVLALLRIIINFGIKNGYCVDVPRSQLYFDMPKVDNIKTEVLNEEQLQALLKALDEEQDQNAAAFMRLALVTGMRKNALMNLRWDDIDFEKGFITLRGDVAKKKKTATIPLNVSARKILNSITRIANKSYVFPGFGSEDIPRKEFKRIADRVRKKAGLPADFRPLHGLRHTYASRLASSGKVDMYTLQKLLTHENPMMTQRYAHLADEAMRRAASVADEIFDVKDKD